MNVQANIGNSNSVTKDVTITFPQPFTNPPEGIPFSIIIVANVVLDPAYSTSTYTDSFTVSVANVTNNGFTARVTRVDSPSGWDMNLNLNYIAISNTIY